MTSPKVIAYVGIGSNVGDRHAHVDQAFAGLALLPLTTVLARSSIIETDPVGPPGQGPYLNAAASISTGLSPQDLLRHFLRIELQAGRDRLTGVRWGPRTLDLDLLVYGDRSIAEPNLTVPHPRLHERRFVLDPLVEIAPDLRIPGFGGRTVADLRRTLLESGIPPD